MAFHSVDSASSANEDLEDYPVEYLTPGCVWNASLTSAPQDWSTPLTSV